MKKINFSILEKYILRQIFEVFIFGMLVFTSIIFASDTFTTLIKQISNFGMPVHVAFMLILLNIPGVLVMTVPISVLFATVMSVNRMSLASEITVLKACGVSINKIAKPIFIFAIAAAIFSFFVNETIVPITMKQSKYLAMWSITQRHIPQGKKNFTLKELKDGHQLKRFFYVENCENDKFSNVSVLDFSDPEMVQIIQAKTGSSTDKGWLFKNASAYTVTPKGRSLSTSWLEETVIDFGSEVTEKINNNDFGKSDSFAELALKLIKNSSTMSLSEKRNCLLNLFDKTAFPFTSIILVILGIPLAITPPRARYNRGFVFSIMIIFFYYIIRAFSFSFGESGILPAFVAAWLPNVVIAGAGALLYYKKAYKI